MGHRQFCPNMKKVRIENVLNKLKNLQGDIEITEDLRMAAIKPLDRMLEMTGK